MGIPIDMVKSCDASTTSMERHAVSGRSGRLVSFPDPERQVCDASLRVRGLGTRLAKCTVHVILFGERAGLARARS